MSLDARTAGAYARHRAEDPRIAAAIHAARTVVNVAPGWAPTSRATAT